MKREETGIVSSFCTAENGPRFDKFIFLWYNTQNPPREEEFFEK